MQTSHSTITDMLSQKYKIALLATLAAMLVVDVAAIVYLSVMNIFGWYFAFPIIFAVLDAIYLLVTAVSNQRFKYARRYIIAYSILTLLTVFIWLLAASQASDQVFTDNACVWWSALHVGGIIVAAIAFTYAATRRGIHTVVAIAFTALFAFAGVAYVFFMSTDSGYFGQGKQRTLVYEYDEDDSCRVVGVLDGRGGDVTVPSEFNGKKVHAVSAQVFKAKGVKNVTLECSTGVAFYDMDKLDVLPSSLNIYAPKSELDGFKKKFYGFSEQVAFDIGNRLAPGDLAADEACVTFAYDGASYAHANEVAIPTWYGKKGDTFEIKLPEIESVTADYAVHSDIESDADLLWGVDNLNGYIMSELRANDTPLVGAKVNGNIYAVPVSFQKIYRVLSGASNDVQYPTTKSFVFSERDGTKLDCRYTVASNADRIIAPFERNGFTLVWKDGNNTFTSLSERLQNETAGSVTISPSWSLIAPEVELTAVHGTNIIYGDPFGLSATASHVLDAEDTQSAFPIARYSYTWTKMEYTPVDGDGNTSVGKEVSIGTESSYSVDSMPFDGGGKYTLNVELSAPRVTSLTATVTKEVNVDVSRRTVIANWTDPQNAVYDGTQKTVSVALTQMVAGDDVALDNTSFAHTDADTYTDRVALTGDTADRYTLAGASHSFTLQPMGVAVTWSNTDLTFNGTAQAPVPSANGVAGALDVKVSGARTNAGNNYTATASIADTNYTIVEGKTYVFAIKQRGVTVSWYTPTTHVYDGNAWVPSATATGLNGELKVNVTGEQVNANTAGEPTYTATAALTDSNYKIDVGQTQAFTIEQCPVTIDWEGLTLTYNGGSQAPTATATGVNDAKLTLDVTGAQTNVGSGYIATASLRSADSRNYVISGSASAAFDIEKMKVAVIWGGTAHTYDGNPFAPTATAKGANNVTLTLVVSGAQTNANTTTPNYTATAALSSADSANYEIQGNADIAFTVSAKSVAVVWGVATHTYDGNVFVPTATFTDVNGNAVELTVDGGKTDAGSYTATASTSDTNYLLLNATTPFTVNKMRVTVVWGSTTHEYDGNPFTPTATAVGAKGATITLGVNGSRTDFGSDTVTAMLNSADSVNYEISGSATTTITVTSKPVAVVWGTTTHVYDGNAWAPTATFTDVSGKTVNLTVTGMQTNVGNNYTATASTTDGNYTLTGATTTFAITARSVAVAWGTTTHVYDGNAWAPTATFTNVNNETVNLTVTGAQTNVGNNYTATASTTDGNYTLTNATTTFAITAKSVAVAWGTTTHVYDGNAWAPTATFTNVNNETVNLTVTGAQTNVGNNYTATASTTDGNYTLTNATTTFAITAKSVAVAWGTTTHVYDGNAWAPTATFTNVNNETVNLTVTGMQTNVGNNYTATASTTDGNYTLTGATTTFAITAKAVTVTVGSATVKYGEALPTISYTVSGLVGSDELSVTVSVVGLTEDGEGNAPVGEYVVTAAASGDNYSVTVIDGKLTVEANEQEVE